jgi:Fur family transcriptional regulator, ferric uptake regulator
MGPVVDMRLCRMVTMWITLSTDTCITITKGIVTTMGRLSLPESETKAGLQRNTRQKAAIREVFIAEGRPLGPQEVLEQASGQIEGLGIATVYRNIKSLLEEGWLNEVELPGEPSRYEIAGKGHHHHFHCLECKRVFDVPGCPIQVKPTLPAGFVTTRHEVVLYGKCMGCSQKSGKRS